MTLPMSAKDLLPQKFPFQMIDRLVHSSDEKIETDFTILLDNVLCVNDEFCEGGLLENMAQSAAAGTGFRYTSQNKEVPVGYIGAIKKVQIYRLPKVGDSISTELRTINQIGNASVVAGKIFLQKEMIASAELTIFVAQ